MPFRLKISQDVFHMRMDSITERLTGIISIRDDIYIFGKTQQEHDKNLLQLMRVAQQNGLVFNSNKCHISQPQISFYGAVSFSKRDEARPKESSSLTRAYNSSSTERTTVILGLINYLQPFLPDIAHKTTFLREQVSKWDWTPSTDASFHCLKTMDLQHLIKNNTSIL